MKKDRYQKEAEAYQARMERDKAYQNIMEGQGKGDNLAKMAKARSIIHAKAMQADKNAQHQYDDWAEHTKKSLEEFRYLPNKKGGPVRFRQDIKHKKPVKQKTKKKGKRKMLTDEEIKKFKNNKLGYSLKAIDQARSTLGAATYSSGPLDWEKKVKLPKEPYIEVYTEGASVTAYNALGAHMKPSDKAAWAFYITYQGETYSDSGMVKRSTNNAMALKAIIEALRYLDMKRGKKYPYTVPIVVISDSQYSLKPMMTKDLKPQEGASWYVARNPNRPNVELWQDMFRAIKWLEWSDRTRFTFKWIKGSTQTKGKLVVDQLISQELH